MTGRDTSSGGEPGGDLPLDSLIECMIMMGAADGVIHHEEVARLAATVCAHPVFEGTGVQEVTDAISAAAARLVKEGFEARLVALTERLSGSYQLRMLAFAFATGISFADGELAPAELNLLKRFQSELELRDVDVAEVMAAIERREDIDDLIDRLREEHMSEQLNREEAYIECMLLMAAADGEVQEEEATQLALTIANRDEFAAMSEQDIASAVSGALERIQRDGNAARLDALAGLLVNEDERLKAMMFAYSILVADGVMAPGESRCLEAMQRVFELGNEDLRRVLESVLTK